MPLLATTQSHRVYITFIQPAGAREKTRKRIHNSGFLAVWWLFIVQKKRKADCWDIFTVFLLEISHPGLRERTHHKNDTIYSVVYSSIPQILKLKKGASSMALSDSLIKPCLKTEAANNIKQKPKHPKMKWTLFIREIPLLFRIVRVHAVHCCRLNLKTKVRRHEYLHQRKRIRDNRQINEGESRWSVEAC